MLVDVVEMRVWGVKRSRDELLQAVPVRGELSMASTRPDWYPASRFPPLMAGLIKPGRSEWLLDPLDQAFVRSMQGDAFVVTGVQQVATLGGRRLQEFRQAWWCRVVVSDG